MADISIDSDSGKFKAGDGQDLNLYHNGTNSFIENETGILYVTNKADANLILGTNNTTAVTIDNSGNVGIGTTPDTYHSSVYALQFTNGAIVTETTTGASKSFTLAYNQYIDSGNAWTYINADEASYYQQYNGTHAFSTAAAGSADGDVTNNVRLYINNDGDVGIGSTSPGIADEGATVTIEDSSSVPSLELSRKNDSISDNAQIGILRFYHGSSTQRMAGQVDMIENGTSENAADMRFWTSTGGSLGLGMTINSSGRVHIGASASDAILRLRQDSAETSPGTNDGTCLYLTGYNANNKYGGGIGWNWNDCGTGVHPSCWIGTYSQSFSSYTKSDLVFATRDVVTNSAPTERMRITTAGNIGIGTDGPPTNLSLYKASGDNDLMMWSNVHENPPKITFRAQDGSAGALDDGDGMGMIYWNSYDGSDWSQEGGMIKMIAGEDHASDNAGSHLTFKINTGQRLSTEVVRFCSNQKVAIGTTTPTGHLTVVGAGTDGSGIGRIQSSATSGTPEGLLVYYPSVAPDNDGWGYYLQDSSAARFIVRNDGDVENHDNDYGATSDERIKDNITDAKSQWDDIKALRVRNFQRKDDIDQYGADKAMVQIGLIAQEVEPISSGLIEEKRPSDYEKDVLKIDGDVKVMKYSVLYMKAIKCLQEAMERIEALENA